MNVQFSKNGDVATVTWEDGRLTVDTPDERSYVVLTEAEAQQLARLLSPTKFFATVNYRNCGKGCCGGGEATFEGESLEALAKAIRDWSPTVYDWYFHTVMEGREIGEEKLSDLVWGKEKSK